MRRIRSFVEYRSRTDPVHPDVIYVAKELEAVTVEAAIQLAAMARTCYVLPTM